MSLTPTKVEGGADAVGGHRPSGSVRCRHGDGPLGVRRQLQCRRQKTADCVAARVAFPFMPPPCPLAPADYEGCTWDFYRYLARAASGQRSMTSKRARSRERRCRWFAVPVGVVSHRESDVEHRVDRLLRRSSNRVGRSGHGRAPARSVSRNAPTFTSDSVPTPKAACSCPGTPTWCPPVPAGIATRTV